MSEFEQWIGRSQTVHDRLEPARSNALSIALGRDDVRKIGDELPLLHHWLYFWDVQPPAGLGVDGHPAKGGFLPPIPLPRRMWAGGRLDFLRPLKLGADVVKTSTITAVKEKTGKSGKLIFVTVRHELDSGDGVAIREEQDLVYREPASNTPALPVAAPAPADAVWCETVNPDSVLLFRYSALTMNGHRIHYDRPYATGEEAYPALVVQGPLQATLLMTVSVENLRDPVTSMAFRGQLPAFGDIPLHICGTPNGTGAEVWTQQGDAKSMIATITTGSNLTTESAA